MKTRLLFQHGLGSLALMSSTAWAASNVSFSQSVETVEAYDYVEVTLNVDKPDARNPFLDVAVTGSFSKTDGGNVFRLGEAGTVGILNTNLIAEST